MYKEWKFLLNGVELELDLRNWKDLGFKIKRDKKYWGYTRKPSLDTLIFLGNDAKTVSRIFDQFGVNATAEFEIKRKAPKYNIYNTFQKGQLDLFEYKKKYFKSGSGKFQVEVALVDSGDQQKLRTRETQNLVIGKPESVEHEVVDAFSSVDVLYKSRGIYKTANSIFGFLEDIADVSTLVNAVVAAPNGGIHLFFSPNFNTDLEFARGKDDRQTIPSWTGALTVNNNFTVDSYILEEHSEVTGLPLDIEFEYNMQITKDILGNTTFSSNYVLEMGLFVIKNNVSNDFVEVSKHTNIHNILIGDTELNASGSITITKQPDELVCFGVRVVSGGALNAFSPKFDFIFKKLETISDTSHKSYLIYECFESLLQQITGSTDIFESNLLGRTDIGYPVNGEASEIAVTNGLFLRNALFTAGRLPELQLKFIDLYKTLDAIYGIAMWYDGKFHIEKREDVFGNNEIELDVINVETVLDPDLFYSRVKVGNKQIKYENINGTNEHNTILEFSTPLRVKENELTLLTKYNTDYLGVELARRARFEIAANKDTKYDDKVFLVRVFNDGGVWTVLNADTDANYTTVNGILLAPMAANLDFSPKRMLLNNSDLLASAMHKNTSDFIRFEKSENLAELTTQKVGEPIIEELANVDYSEFKPAIFNPIFHNFEVGKKEIDKILNNQNNVFVFEINCPPYNIKRKVKGFLWDSNIKGYQGKIKLLEKA